MALGGPIPDKSFPVLVYNMERADEFVNSDALVFVDRFDKNRKTITALTLEAQAAYRLASDAPQGNYGVGVVYEESNWTYFYNNEYWGLSDTFDLSQLPYTATEADPNNDTANLMVRSNASQSYVQDYVGSVTNYQADSVADMVQGKTTGSQTVVLAEGQVWETSGYYVPQYGGARYLIRLLSDIRTEKSDPLWNPDGYRDHLISGGNLVAFLSTIETPWAEQYGLKRDDSSLSVAQHNDLVLDSYKENESFLLFGQGSNRSSFAQIDKPLQLSNTHVIMGKGQERFDIRKATSTQGTGSNLANSGAVIDSYEVIATVIFTHEDNDRNKRSGAEGIRFVGEGYVVEYGIYAPRMEKPYLRNVVSYGHKFGYFTHDTYLATFDKVECNSNSVAPNGVPKIAPSAYGWPDAKGFVWSDDGTGNTTGTTCNFISCWARDCHVGYDIFGLDYSTMNGCASDNITSTPYKFSSTKMVMNGCGAEKVKLASNTGVIAAFGSRITNNNFRYFNVDGGSGSASYFADNSKIINNNCQFEDFVDDAGAFNVIIQNGSNVIDNETQRPSNGNSFISFSNGSTRVRTNNGVTIRDDSLSSTSLFPAVRGSGSVAAAGNVDTGLGRRVENIRVNIVPPSSDTAPTVEARVTESLANGIFKVRYYNLSDNSENFGTFTVEWIGY